MNEVTKSRRERIQELIRKNPKYTQGKLLEILNNEGHICSQSTVHRDLKYFKLQKGQDGYVKTKKIAVNEQMKLLRSLIAHEDPQLFSSKVVKTMFLPTNYGSERAICDLIADIYRDMIIGVFVGNGCVMIAGTASNLNSISDDIYKFRKRLQ